MRRVVLPLAVLLALGALATPASADTVHADVVGGSNAALGDAPWQALVLPGGAMCGGSILDATHVVTAAHCVEGLAPAGVRVYAGLVDIQSPPGPAEQRSDVTAIAVHPSYTFPSYDAAVLALATPLTFTSAVQPIALATAADDAAMTTSSPLLLTGWGTTNPVPPNTPNNDPASQILQKATINPTTGCQIYSGYDNSISLCAAAPGRDACQGDSGGPLVLPGIEPKLVGIVSGGEGCAQAGYPGFYTRVAAPAIRNFLIDPTSGLPVPANVSRPSLVGDRVTGSTLSCAAGQWTNAASYVFRYVRADSAVLRDWSADATYAPTAADSGNDLRCDVRATAAGGRTAEASSAWASITNPVPAVPLPTAPATPVDPAPRPDTGAPVAHVTKITCTSKGCTLDVRIDDPAPSGGVRPPETRVTTTYRARCRRGSARSTCRRNVTKKLKATLVSGAVYRIRTGRLRAGTQTFTLVAVDVAGHRQALPTTVRRRTR